MIPEDPKKSPPDPKRDPAPDEEPIDLERPIEPGDPDAQPQ